MEINLIEGIGERLFTHAGRLEDLDTGLVAEDARFPRPGAQRIGDFGWPPMGMHVDHHGCFLHGLLGSLTPQRLTAKQLQASRMAIHRVGA
jgi:hypothetical protein